MKKDQNRLKKIPILNNIRNSASKGIEDKKEHKWTEEKTQKTWTWTLELESRSREIASFADTLKLHRSELQATGFLGEELKPFSQSSQSNSPPRSMASLTGTGGVLWVM